MPGRPSTQVLALITALALCSLAASAHGASSTARIIAVGDLHGDYEAWRAIARDAGLIDERGRWTGGGAVLVQTGDVVDRGPDSRKILNDLMRLQREAGRASGRVIALVGNHEAMNLTGDLRYVSAGEYAAYADRHSATRREAAYRTDKATIETSYRARDLTMTSKAIKQAWLAATPLGFLEHQAAWRPDGTVGRWVVGNPAVTELQGSVFVHGGISPAYARKPMAEVNLEVAAALAARATAPESIINDLQGPLWHRGFAAAAATGGPDAGAPDTAAPTASADPVAAQLDQVLAAYGARRMVIGHTPVLSGIAIQFGGRLVRIDTGISFVYGGKVSYLEIRDGVLVPHTVERPVKAGAR